MTVRTGAGSRDRAGGPRRADYLLVVLVWLLSSPGVGARVSGIALAVQVVVTAVASAALLWRREYPVRVLAVALASLLVMTISLPYPVLPGSLAVALYAIGRYAPARVCWSAAVIAGLVYSGSLVALHISGMTILSRDASGPLPTALLVAGLLQLPLLMLVASGQLVRLQRELKDRDRAEAAAAAVRAERLRIARELHDVVAHHMSTVTILIGAADTIVGTDPRRARQTLATAAQNARDAMVELRQLLRVLRVEDTRHPDQAAGVTALPALVRTAGEAGQRVRLDVTGTAIPLPTAVDHAVYRLVQESLTNTRKHAPGATATVVVAYEPDAVEVRVSNGGPTAGNPTPKDGMGGGFGLTGMAERVALCGGTLQVGPSPEGGFLVHARIPVDQDDDRRRSRKRGLVAPGEDAPSPGAH